MSGHKGDEGGKREEGQQSDGVFRLFEMTERRSQVDACIGKLTEHYGVSSGEMVTEH